MAESVSFTTPVGRLVSGSLYKPSTTNMQGQPLITKHGANAGQPRSEFFFGIAIPKGVEKHWSETVWGKTIWDVGHKGWPNGQAQSPSFSWKITDGDSTVPNKSGGVPAKREGYARHWVLGFKSGTAPRIFQADGKGGFLNLVDENAIRPGYYIQVQGSVSSNDNSTNPGVYLNHSMVCLSGYGPEISLGVRPEDAGFGGALPPGASAVPVAATSLPVAATAPHAVTPVFPDPAFLAGPGTAPPPPPPPPVAPAKVMTAKAGGATYEMMITAGWSDATLIQHGYMNP